mmetsp:Transcript_125157/g.226959  ORF Transcript_125157/g.226959 Transcript_125157/m.226959 type:complete len:226 (-) Transcript_125157:7-684(-)
MAMLFLWKCRAMALRMRSCRSDSSILRLESAALISSRRFWKITLPSSNSRKAPSFVAKLTKPHVRSRKTSATRPHCEKKSPTSSSLSHSPMPPTKTLHGSPSPSKSFFFLSLFSSFRRGVAKPIVSDRGAPGKSCLSTTAQSASAANLNVTNAYGDFALSESFGGTTLQFSTWPYLEKWFPTSFSRVSDGRLPTKTLRCLRTACSSSKRSRPITTSKISGDWPPA